MPAIKIKKTDAQDIFMQLGNHLNRRTFRFSADGSSMVPQTIHDPKPMESVRTWAFMNCQLQALFCSRNDKLFFSEFRKCSWCRTKTSAWQDTAAKWLGCCCQIEVH